LSTPPERSGDPTLRGGVEIDRYGAPLAYWIRKQHPGDLYAGWYRPDIAEYERVPAFTPWGRRRVLHLHDKERTGQSRGKPLVTAVMREFRMAGEYATTELQSAVANALIAAFLESNLDTESAAALFGSGQDQNPESYWKQAIGEYRATLRGGAVIPLPAGARLASFTPSRPNTGFADFMAAVLRHIAAGLNLPYELLVKDFSKTNYSSARAALLEAWRHFQSKRRSLIDYWLLPIYQLWLEEAVNRARVEAPGYYDNRYAYARARWIFAGRGWVDPVKEANAAKIRMAASLSTLEAECAEQGLDWQEVLEQRAAEKDMAKRLGLDLNTDVTPDARPEASEPEET
jgi:lambda family phage portal protein